MAGLFGTDLVDRAKEMFQELEHMDESDAIETINAIRLILHEHSPLKAEPVDCVLWVPLDEVIANDYNPNAVAPPEMELLRHSIEQDGYTQPIVSWAHDDIYEVVDGFHRNRVGHECKTVRHRTRGYLPLTVINPGREERTDRIAATIRHNRARGKHLVDSMSDIVVELKRRNWSDTRICRELGMDQDEVLRLCQVTGLTDLFSDQEFSKSWDVEGEVEDSDYEELTDDITQYGEEANDFRTINTDDEDRIFHKYDKWECYKAGFYKNSFEGMDKAECQQAYCDFLTDAGRFSNALEQVITEWKYSCEHYLTNSAMNRIAWLGQASMCYDTGIPSAFRSGFFLLTPEQQEEADNTAWTYLNKWLVANGRETVEIDDARTSRQSDVY